MFTKSVVSTIVLAVLAVAPVMARVNHADAYGYPHNRGPPPPGPRQPITPGGFKDPRPANPGAVCTANNQCSTNVVNARASCGADGVCSFMCLGQTQFDGTACTGQIIAPRCSFNRQCPTSVDNATGVCVAGRCSFACNNGFFAKGSTCAAAERECGGQACPNVPGGYSVCENNQCTAKCEAHLGYKQFCNADNSVCQCIDVSNDVNNCGTPGNSCPSSYNGKGKAYCAGGQCGLSCNRLTKVTPRDGAPYCSSL